MKKAAEEAKRDYQDALKELDDAVYYLSYADRSVLSEALNERGEVWRELGKWEQAIADFQQSLELSGEEDSHVAAKNRVDLATTYHAWSQACSGADRSEKEDQAIDHAECAFQIATRTKSFHTVSRAERVLADVFLQRSDYAQAYQHAAASVVHIMMLDHNSTENRATKLLYYTHWQEWLLELLQKTPREQRKKHINFLLKQWPLDERDYDGFALTVRLAEELEDKSHNVV